MSKQSFFEITNYGKLFVYFYKDNVTYFQYIKNIQPLGIKLDAWEHYGKPQLIKRNVIAEFYKKNNGNTFLFCRPECDYVLYKEFIKYLASNIVPFNNTKFITNLIRYKKGRKEREDLRYNLNELKKNKVKNWKAREYYFNRFLGLIYFDKDLFMSNSKVGNNVISCEQSYVLTIKWTRTELLNYWILNLDAEKYQNTEATFYEQLHRACNEISLNASFSVHDIFKRIINNMGKEYFNPELRKHLFNSAKLKVDYFHLLALYQIAYTHCFFSKNPRILMNKSN